MAGRRFLSQPRISGSHRTPMGTSVIPDIERWIQKEMRVWKVSRAFVIATCVAFVAGIEEQPDYRKPLGEYDKRRATRHKRERVSARIRPKHRL